MRGQQTGVLDPYELWRALPRALRRAGNVDSVELKVTADSVIKLRPASSTELQADSAAPKISSWK